MRFKRKIRLDRITSSTTPARIGQIVEVSPDCVAEEGAVIAVRSLGDKKVYGHVELPSGRMAKVVKGNILAGVLGARKALHGYMGHVPKSLEPGDIISILNIGGVLGICDAPNKDLGPPISVEVLGHVTREGRPVNIRDKSLPACEELSAEGPPLVLVVGTCMNSGKTFAASEIIRILSHSGVRIAAGKLSGVAALRDTLAMADNGAIATASFLSCGLPSTVNSTDLGSVARSVIQHLERSNPELIVLELGDGIIGGYNTGSILDDASIRRRTRTRVLCANDLVGAWGAERYLAERGHRPDIVSGPVTDNAVGTTYISSELGLDSANARIDAVLLAQLVANSAQLELEVSA